MVQRIPNNTLHRLISESSNSPFLAARFHESITITWIADKVSRLIEFNFESRFERKIRKHSCNFPISKNHNSLYDSYILFTNLIRLISLFYCNSCRFLLTTKRLRSIGLVLFTNSLNVNFFILDILARIFYYNDKCCNLPLIFLTLIPSLWYWFYIDSSITISLEHQDKIHFWRE